MKKVLLGIVALSTTTMAQENNLYLKVGANLNSKFNKVDYKDSRFSVKGKVGPNVNIEFTRNITNNAEVGFGFGYIPMSKRATFSKEFSYLTNERDINKVDTSKLVSNDEISRKLSNIDDRIKALSDEYYRISSTPSSRVVKTVEEVRAEALEKYKKAYDDENIREGFNITAEEREEEFEDFVDFAYDEIISKNLSGAALDKAYKQFLKDFAEYEWTNRELKNGVNTEESGIGYDKIAPDMEEAIREYIYARPVYETSLGDQAKLKEIEKEKEKLIVEKTDVIRSLAGKQLVKRTVKGELPKYDSFPLYITGKYTFEVQSNIKPYIKADFGYSFNKTRGRASYSDVITMDNQKRIVVNEVLKPKIGNGLYYSVGVGAQYNNFLTELAYVHTDAKVKWSNGEKSKYNNDAVRLSVGYKFAF